MPTHAVVTDGKRGWARGRSGTAGSGEAAGGGVERFRRSERSDLCDRNVATPCRNPCHQQSQQLDNGRVFLPTNHPAGMSSVTILWSMAAAASLTLGMVHLIVWWQNREKRERLLFVMMTAATAWMSFHELAMMMSRTPEEFGAALRWIHLPTWLNFFAVTGFVLIHLRAGRLWLALLAIGVRFVTLVINFSIYPNINFREITGLLFSHFLQADKDEAHFWTNVKKSGVGGALDADKARLAAAAEKAGGAK